MDYEFATLTDTGRVRANNEDAVLADPHVGLALLADGMGGHNAGEVAANMAVTLIHTELGDWLQERGGKASEGEIRAALEASVVTAHRAIFAASLAHLPYSGMGTTLVAGAFQANRLVLCHVGDSRCYRWRRHHLSRITRDHSVLQERMDAGLLTPEEAANSPDGNLVTRAMGVEAAIEPEIHEFTVLHGDVYLMCSDGLSDLVSDEALADILATTETLTNVAQRLVHQANLHGGVDNVSVVLARAQQAPRGPVGVVGRWLGI
jgi:PPM family protein phosphatase